MVFSESVLDSNANNFVKNLLNDDDYFDVVMNNCIQNLKIFLGGYF